LDACKLSEAPARRDCGTALGRRGCGPALGDLPKNEKWRGSRGSASRGRRASYSPRCLQTGALTARGPLSCDAGSGPSSKRR
jgi:hypothetical protein